MNFRSVFLLLFLLGLSCISSASERSPYYAVKLTVTSDLPMQNVPMDPLIDFEDLIRQNNLPGMLDHTSIELINLATGQPVPFSLSASLTYGQKGRLQWVIENPDHREYEIRFQTTPDRTYSPAKAYTPMVGVGDVFRYNAGVPRPVAMVHTEAFIDVTGDGKRDLLGFWIYPRFTRGLVDPLPGTGPVVYPRVGSTANFEFGEPVAWQGDLPVDIKPATVHEVAFDVDNDGHDDRVILQPCRDNPESSGYLFGNSAVWQRNRSDLGPDAYDPPLPLESLKDLWPVNLIAVNEGPLQGLIVQTGSYQNTVFYQHTPNRKDGYFQVLGKAVSLSAVMELGGDQAWPYICDWDDDGDCDLLIGGGIGWPRILINYGTNDRPAFNEAQYILSEGQPIRIWMSQVFPGCEKYKHNMGYSYPKFIDWDNDGLKDLMLPNITNRIFWYKNIGTAKKPVFGRRLQITPENYTETPEKLAETGRYLMEHWEGEPQKDQPFWWRTGAGFADFNNDDLMDMITLDGFTRKLKLFCQYKNNTGNLLLKAGFELKLTDGRVICEDVVARVNKHWTESFQCRDWDGDGLIDIMYSLAGGHGNMLDGGSIYLLRNCGTKTEPVFENPRTMSCYGSPIMITKHGPHPAVGDLNGDGKPDILTCHEDSIYAFFSHVALEMTQRPQYEIGKLETIEPVSKKTDDAEPRIIVNDDSDSSFYTMNEPYTPEQLYPLIDVLKDTQVDVYIYCVNRGGDTYAHRTKIAEMLGDQKVSWHGTIFKEMIEKQQGVQKAGIDPLKVLSQRAKQQGIKIWAGFRMNDIHEDFEVCSILRSNFKKQHPELHLGSPYPEPHEYGNTESNYSFTWNWAKEEVRNRFLALIEEVCTNYDIDGVELDYLRGPYYFKTGERRAGMPLMNDFLRKARATVDRIAKQKNRKLILAVRVDRTIADAEAKGLDVRTWLNEDLVDVMTPMFPGRLDMQADLQSFAVISNGRCRFAGGVEGQSYGYGHQPDNDFYPWRYPPLRMLRAAAAGYYDQGAKSIYLFNYLPHVLYGDRTERIVQDKVQALHEMGDPEILVQKDKHYIVSIDQLTDMNQLPSEPIHPSPVLQLPAEPMARIGDQRRFTLWIGDDIESARQNDQIKNIFLRCQFDNYWMPNDMIRIRLNGRWLDYEASPWRHRGLVLSDVPVRTGLNEIILELTKHPENANTPVVIKTIDLIVDYK